MINLLPQHQQKRVSRERILRMFVVGMLSLSFVLTAFAALTLPTDILISSLQQHNQANLEDAKEAEASYLELKTAVSETSDLVNFLKVEERVRFSEQISTIDELTGGEVSIKEFRFSDAGKVVTLSGEAMSRSGLSGFRNALEADEGVASVELPLSNLAKDSDIPFTMTVTFSDRPK